ncbi:MAG TPA: site-specific recombinase [Rubrivivax sp.]|nr:site-specific recombinase [Rubrivivax sp.]HPO19155.1 site-specific recombinase [Rubrivivax sp.]
MRWGHEAGRWDLSALLNAAEGLSGRAQRHLWLARLLEWLRHEPREAPADGATPPALLRLRHLLNVLENNPEYGQRVQKLFVDFWGDIRAVGLFSDFGFSPRTALYSEVLERLRLHVLPATPDTRELAELFALLFRPADASWVAQIDAATLQRLGSPGWRGVTEGADPWRAEMLDAIGFLVGAIGAAGFSGPLRQRMSEDTLARKPFRQLAASAERLREQVLAGEPDSTELRQAALYLRALLDQCLAAVDSIGAHLDEYGISVDIVYAADLLRARVRRVEQLADCVLSPTPGPQIVALCCELLRALEQRRGVRALLVRHYAQLSRKMAQRSAETGEHYIAHTRAEYRSMLRRAAIGGAVMSATTLLKFAVLAIGLGAFWSGAWAGFNYAASFVLIMLLHGTVATKQPAMTAPAMAQRLGDLKSDTAVEAFVDDVVHLLRSQAAGIFGNLALCGPLVFAAQWLSTLLRGQPLVGAAEAEHVLHALTLLGPTVLYAAFTGVLLFFSSILAGWMENWFVFHRLDSAIAWNPRIVARLGASRALRWAHWWRCHISGITANVSLGLMLGLVPVLTGFFGPTLDVRHVTLSTGQLGAVAGALGWAVLHTSGFWWCVAGVAATGLLNVGVSFWLAFELAARSRGVRVVDRQRIRAALLQRLRTRLPSFLWPTASS